MEDTRDTLMSMKVGGAWLKSECSAVVDRDFDLLVQSDEFAAGTFFAVEEFEIEMGLSSDASEDPQAAIEAQAKHNKAVHKQLDELAEQMAALRRHPNEAAGAGKKGKLGGEKSEKFAKFLKNPASIRGADSYPSELEPISITRRMDIASVTLFDKCQNLLIIDKAVLIKRRALGGNKLLSYFRIDFTDILITDFDWQEDEVVKESFKFICRGVDISYRPEVRGSKSGKGGREDQLGKTVGPMGWKYVDMDRKK
jgi:hypothetical protein